MWCLDGMLDTGWHCLRREDFHVQLLAATFAALRFSQELVKNRLVLNVRYLVILNQSCDFNASGDEVVYPEDDGRFQADLTDSDVVDLLFRNGCCPEWIDIAVAGADRKTTLVSLYCCGRFCSEESRMYYTWTGFQPFGVKGPDLPKGWREGRKFSVPRPGQYLSALIQREHEYQEWRKLHPTGGEP